MNRTFTVGFLQRVILEARERQCHVPVPGRNGLTHTPAGGNHTRPPAPLAPSLETPHAAEPLAPQEKIHTNSKEREREREQK